MQTPSDMFESVTVRRYGTGSWVGGRWAEGSYVTITVVGAVQPGGMRELMTLEEGDRSKDTLTIWTQTALLTEDEVAQRAADRIVYGGEVWQVRRVESFGLTPELRHYHAIAIREQAR